MTLFGKTIRWFVLSAAGAFVTLAPAQAVPVVPNFTETNDEHDNHEIDNKRGDKLHGLQHWISIQRFRKWR